MKSNLVDLPNVTRPLHLQQQQQQVRLQTRIRQMRESRNESSGG